VPDQLAALLERARELGFLGPGDPAAHRDHASAFVAAWEAEHGVSPASVCDLGTGGGVPGLVLALHWPAARVVLLEAAQRRCAFLEDAVGALGLSATTSVAQGRAESLGRTLDLEGAFELVTARSFGPPAVAAECGARLLAPGGVLMVAEPPDGAATADRWPDDGLAVLGLGPARPTATRRRLVVIERTGPCPDRYPRRVGMPSKRPLF
jgi:16S rRNA (guanine527-N7)-methyltransferase